MKAYTDKKQSKKLAEILPIESADMHYVTWTILENGEFVVSMNQTDTIESLQEEYGKQIIPCWSLAALLEIIPKRIKEDNIFRIDVGVNDSAVWYDELSYGVNNDLPDITADNLVDACYEMIVKLHELNLLEL